MLRRRESFLLVEQAVTVDANEIDALVAKIGETLQFQRLPSGGAATQQEHNEQQQHLPPPPPPRGPAKCGMCCMDRLKVPSRNKPYEVPARMRDPGQAASSTASSRSKSVRRALESPAYELNAQQKLEQLLSSGNLIKEAVRRLRIDHDYSPLYLEKIPL